MSAKEWTDADDEYWRRQLEARGEEEADAIERARIRLRSRLSNTDGEVERRRQWYPLALLCLLCGLCFLAFLLIGF